VRLLFITERFPPDIGGLASSAGRITAILCQLGLEVDVLAWSRYLQPGEVRIDTQNEELLNQPRSHHNIPVPKLYRMGLYRQWEMTMPHTLNVLEWLHQQRPYNAVWGHYIFPSGFLATWWGQLQGIPSTVSVRGNDIDKAMFPPGDFARLQWTLERANLITAVSQDLARKVQVLVRRDDVMVLKNSVNDQIFFPKTEPDISSLRTKLGIEANEIVLGFAGELREKKGQQFLLSALTTVRRRKPACLLIIGEVRPSQAAMLQLYAMQFPEDYQRIIITGHLAAPEAVAEHLQLCDVYLQPSLWEGLPNALLEAMACGCCCLGSDAGGIAEVIEPGKNGFILPRWNLHQLGGAVLEILDLAVTERKQIGAKARDRILTEYSLTQEKIRLQAVITQLIVK